MPLLPVKYSCQSNTPAGQILMSGKSTVSRCVGKYLDIYLKLLWHSDIILANAADMNPQPP